MAFVGFCGGDSVNGGSRISHQDTEREAEGADQLEEGFHRLVVSVIVSLYPPSHTLGHFIQNRDVCVHNTRMRREERTGDDGTAFLTVRLVKGSRSAGRTSAPSG